MLFLVLSFAFFSNVTSASDELVVAVGLAKPPYVIQKDNSGFELDLIRNIFKKMGKSTKFVYTQFGHSSKMLDVEAIDAVITTTPRIFSDTSKLSDKYITYQNVAISMKEDDLRIDTIKDLANYTIASFQKADKVLGKEFADAANKSPLFMKVAEQNRQPMLLLKKRVQVLVMDINIFKYFAKKIGIKNISSRFNFHEVFPINHYNVAFKNKQYVKLFNKLLAQYKQTDDYIQLKKHYNL